MDGRNLDRVATSVGLSWAKHITTEHLLRLIKHNITNSTTDRPNRVPNDPQVSISIQKLRAWDARFSHIAASQAQSKTQQSHAREQASLAEQIASIGFDEKMLQKANSEAFSQKLSRLLDLPLEHIHQDDSLSGHSVDSLVTVKFRTGLLERLD